MKKLLTILGAVGLVATTGVTVVACGTEPKDTFSGDDISDQTIKWGLTAYNEKDNHTHQPKLWIKKDKLFDGNGKVKVSLTEKEWSQTIWTGILNYDDKEDGSALPEFNEKKLWTVLHFTFTQEWETIDQFLEDSWESTGENQYTIKAEKSKLLGMVLDVNVLSMTQEVKDGQPTGKSVRYGLEKSKMQFENGLIINIIDEE